MSDKHVVNSLFTQKLVVQQTWQREHHRVKQARSSLRPRNFLVSPL